MEYTAGVLCLPFGQAITRHERQLAEELIRAIVPRLEGVNTLLFVSRRRFFDRG
jgi:hypothetical protein